MGYQAKPSPGVPHPVWAWYESWLLHSYQLSANEPGKAAGDGLSLGCIHPGDKLRRSSWLLIWTGLTLAVAFIWGMN